MWLRLSCWLPAPSRGRGCEWSLAREQRRGQLGLKWNYNGITFPNCATSRDWCDSHSLDLVLEAGGNSCEALWTMSDQNVVIVMIVMTWRSSKSDKIMHSWQLLSTRDNEIIYDIPGPRIDGILIMEWDCEHKDAHIEWGMNGAEYLWDVVRSDGHLECPGQGYGQRCWDRAVSSFMLERNPFKFV